MIKTWFPDAGPERTAVVHASLVSPVDDDVL